MAKIILKDKIGELAPVVIWIYFKGTVIKTVCYGAKTCFIKTKVAMQTSEGRTVFSKSGWVSWASILGKYEPLTTSHHLQKLFLGIL